MAGSLKCFISGHRLFQYYPEVKQPNEQLSVFCTRCGFSLTAINKVPAAPALTAAENVESGRKKSPKGKAL